MHSSLRKSEEWVLPLEMSGDEAVKDGLLQTTAFGIPGSGRSARPQAGSATLE
jgi:hypothetical protein